MKKILWAMTALLTVALSTVAQAQPTQDMLRSLIGGNTGSNLRTYGSTYTCSGAGGFLISGTNCGSPSQYMKIGVNVNNDACCVALTAAAQEHIDQLRATSGFEEVLGEHRTDTFFGYQSSTLRSPNGGRGRSIEAKLDACMNHTNWTPNDPYTSCISTCNDGTKNTHCSANSNAVCLDRCECAYEVGTCNNL